jgi:superfamily II DNA helicase RecQ
VYEIITIPFNSITKTFNTDDLNAFCVNKKVISTKIEFFQDEKHACWTVFLEYEPILEKNGDVPSGLTEAGRLCYEKLREWRKETAEKEGIPPYVIAKNSQLGEIVKKEIKTLEALKQLNGFGAKKIEKYGKDICGIVKAFYSDISEKLDEYIP